MGIHLAWCCRTTLTPGDLAVEKAWQHRRQHSMSFAWAPKIFGVVDSTIANKKIIYRLCLGKWQVLYSLCLYWARVYCCAGLQRFIKMSISSKCVISVPISRYLQSPHSSVTYWAGWGHGDITIIRCAGCRCNEEHMSDISCVSTWLSDWNSNCFMTMTNNNLHAW